MDVGGRLSRFVGSSLEMSGSWVQGSAAQRPAGVVNKRWIQAEGMACTRTWQRQG